MLERKGQNSDAVEEVLTISFNEGRYESFHYIDWWDHQKVRSACALVVGCGALGNEVLKNLALLGIGQLILVDFDIIEESNLSRTVLYRSKDVGKTKVEVAAAAIRQLNPDCRVRTFHGDLKECIGIGMLRRVDVVIGCLDNRYARLQLNRLCHQAGVPWIDGAIGTLLGEVRIFWPGRGACYSCTLANEDYGSMNQRFSCTNLVRMTHQGKIPTTPTMASVIAGIQSQEALKILHGLPVKTGAAWVFNGFKNEAFLTTYPAKENCSDHFVREPVVSVAHLSATHSSLQACLDFALAETGPSTVLYLDFDLLTHWECAVCGEIEPVLNPAEKVDENEAICGGCSARRWPHQTHSLSGHETFLEKSPASIGIPPLHVLSAKGERGVLHFELSGDCDTVFNFT